MLQSFVSKLVKRNRLKILSYRRYEENGKKSLERFLRRFICAHSERYVKVMPGIFEIQLFFGNIAFPLSPVFTRHSSAIDNQLKSGRYLVRSI